MIYKAKYPIYVAKIKVVEKRWHGWSLDGTKIPPKESVHERPSGSRLIIAQETREMVGVCSDENQKTENRLSVDYILKEGYRIFISWKGHDSVDFSPDVTLEPISGKVFPVKHRLPLKKEKLKVGENFEIKPFSMDAGVSYQISLTDIYKSGDYNEVQYNNDPSEEIRDESVIVEKVED